MIYKKLGKNGPTVSAVGLGCMSMTGNYESERDESDSILTLRTAWQNGVNFFDSADMYGKGENEILLGKALRDVLDASRDKIVIATKCGFIFHADGSIGIDLTPEHILKACDGSLSRLNVAYIDLYYLHRLPPENIFEKSLAALVKLIEDNKVKYVGLSEANAQAITQAYNYFAKHNLADRFIAVQTEYSLLTRNPEYNGVLEACRSLGIGFVPYSPLSRALLTPVEKMHEEFKFAADDFRGLLPRFQGKNFKENLFIRDQLTEIAQQKNCTLPQLALAWLIAQGDYIIPIPGTRKVKHMLENIQSCDVKLNQDDCRNIDNILNAGTKGLRYTEDMLRIQNIDD